MRQARAEQVSARAEPVAELTHERGLRAPQAGDLLGFADVCLKRGQAVAVAHERRSAGQHQAARTISHLQNLSV